MVYSSLALKKQHNYTIKKRLRNSYNSQKINFFAIAIKQKPNFLATHKDTIIFFNSQTFFQQNDFH